MCPCSSECFDAGAVCAFVVALGGFVAGLGFGHGCCFWGICVEFGRRCVDVDR